MLGLVRRLIGLADGDRSAGPHDDSSIAGSAAVTSTSCGQSVWTPKGYVMLATPPAGSAACAKFPPLVGGTGYGGTDTSPPTSGYGIGRIYD
jgi:hypothetical protein